MPQPARSGSPFGILRPTRRRAAGAAAFAAALALPAVVCGNAYSSYYYGPAVTTYSSSYGPAYGGTSTAFYGGPATFTPPATFAAPAAFAFRPLFPRLAARRAARRAARAARFAPPAVSDSASYAPLTTASYGATTSYYGGGDVCGTTASYAPSATTYYAPPVSYESTVSYGPSYASSYTPSAFDPSCGTVVNYAPADACGGGMTLSQNSGGFAGDGACPTGDCTSYSFPAGVVPAGGTLIESAPAFTTPRDAAPTDRVPSRSDRLPRAAPDRDRDFEFDREPSRDRRPTDRLPRDRRPAAPRDDRPGGDAYDNPLYDDTDRDASPGRRRDDPIPSDDFDDDMNPGGLGTFGADDGTVAEPDDAFGAGAFGDEQNYRDEPSFGGESFDESADPGAAAFDPSRDLQARPPGDEFDDEADPNAVRRRQSRFRPAAPDTAPPGEQGADDATAPEPDGGADSDSDDDTDLPAAGDGDPPASARGAVLPQLATADLLRSRFRRTRLPEREGRMTVVRARHRGVPAGPASPAGGADGDRPRLVRN